MKKRCLTVVCACICCAVLGMPAFAQTYTAVEIGENNISLHLSSDCGRAQYTVYLLRPNGEIPTGTSGVSDAFERMEEINAQADVSGTYTAHNLTFSLADNASYGVYTMIVGGGELKAEEIRLTYGDPSAVAEAVAEINSADAAAVAGVLEKHLDKAWSLDLERDIMKSQKNAVCEDIAAMIGGAATSERDVINAFEKACIIEEIKHCDMAVFYDKLFLYGAYLETEYPDTVKTASDETAEIFEGLRKTELIRTPAELQKALRASEAVCKVNAADRDNVLRIIREYNDIFGISMKENENSYMLARGMTAKKYKTPADVVVQYSAVQEELSKTGSETIIHGGSGGKGGSGGGFTTPAVGNTVDARLIASLDEKATFEDLAGVAWAKKYIDYVCENNIMVGDGTGRFRPTDAVNRAEFLKVLINALKLETENSDGTSVFQDVPDDAWYVKTVNTGVNLGIVKGVTDTAFAPLQSVSRQDAAVMIVRAVEAAGMQLHTERDEVVFTDAEEIADYASDAVLKLASAAVIDGYENGNFCPRGELLRCETAKIVYSVLSALKK